jgi:hypothetical protein
MAIARARLRSCLDLTVSNPTRVGLVYPPSLLAPLGDGAGLSYAPEPLGLALARAAASAEYARRGVLVPPERVVMTASTSEAYSLLFKLLCNPGDQVLVPRPSYPLFAHLTRLDGVDAVAYDLDPDAGWQIDPDAVARAVTPRTRAVLVVSPNNPTGSVASADALAALGALCRRRGVALVGDEVFADYPLAGGPPAGPSVLAAPQALTFGLGGLSKSIGLPQVKLGWLAAGGPDDLVRRALARLEIIADAYLSVATPVQLAAPRLLAVGAAVRAQIAARLQVNLAQLREAARAHPACTLLHADAGWSAVVQVPAVLSEEALVLDLLERRGVLVHPGYFFDFPREAFLVLSLLPRPEEFGAGVERVFEGMAEGGRSQES